MSISVRLGQLSPFGPIFGKELRVTSRKKRSYALRVGYLGLLLLCLLMTYAASGHRYGGVAQQVQDQAELGAAFFAVFSMFCVIAMGLIAPVLSSTAIGSERLAKTLPVLLMTPISAWQIVSGKLLSRLLAALTLMGLSLPVLALVRLLGGVELHQMVAVLCVCTGFALSSAAIGLLYSTLFNRAYVVILLAFATQLFLYMFVPMIVGLCVSHTAQTGRIFLEAMIAVHPAMAVYREADPSGFIFARLPDHWQLCTAIQIGLAILLVMLSSLSVRRLARREGSRESGVPALAEPVFSTTPPPPPLPPALADLAAPPPLAYAAPALPTPRKAVEVSDHPILWREVRRPLLPRLWMRITAAVLCISLLLLTYLAMGIGDAFDSSRHEEQIGFAIVFAGLYWLLVSVLSATGIASEKESDTWTLLLTAPVSGRAVVWGKVAGLLRRLIWPMALIAAHFALFTLVGYVPLLTLPFVLWVIISFNSIWIATGLYLSLRLRRVTFAVAANLLLAVALYAVVPAVLFVLTSITDASDKWVEHGIWWLPYMYLGNFIASSYRYNGVETYWLPGVHSVGAGPFYLAVFAVGAMHLLAAYLILSRMSVHFDEIVGRAGSRVHAATFESDEAVAIASSAGHGGLYRRAVALVLDNLILQGACIAIATTIGVGVLLIGDSDTAGGVMLLRSAIIGSVAGSILGWPYFAWFESSRRRATPGKWMMGLFVADPDGRRISFLRATARYFTKSLTAPLLWIVYLFTGLAGRNGTVHDMLADTVVLRR